MIARRLKKILLVEDDELTSSLYCMLIEHLRICDEIVVMHDGEEALHYIKQQLSDDGLPELIFIDIKMMGFSGFDLIEELNKVKHDLMSKSRIMILTSSSFPKDIARAEELGILDYIIKPLSEEKLMTLLDQYF